MKHLKHSSGKCDRFDKFEKEFAKELGATAACVCRLAKGSEQDLPDGVKAGIKADSWFGSVVAADELGQMNKRCILNVSVLLQTIF